MKKLILATVVISSFLIMACSSETVRQSFSEKHDSFQTKLVEQRSNQNEIPEPPAGVFELDYYHTDLGEMAAYVSSDPGDELKHPLMIWVVGGWGNGIDDFPWSYPDWDNDQSAVAFREAGILMMYPSFRGANGNPGHDETLFGEINDLVAAYEYAASLPYVDPQRIYLGGHSTGGTKVLLTSEYTDRFRAVFSFGPVDEIKSHNQSQFTFDTSNKDEYNLRSPIHWLQDIKSPTFIIEGEDGNSSCVKKIKQKSKNDQIHSYIIDDADHFSVLAPVTRLLAKKIIDDDGEVSNITLTADELQQAMIQPPVLSYPLMASYTNIDCGFSMKIPVNWEEHDESTDDYSQYSFFSTHEEDNFWDTVMLYVDTYNYDSKITLEEFMAIINYQGDEYQGSIIDNNGQIAYLAKGEISNSNGDQYYVNIVGLQQDDRFLEFWFYSPQEYQDEAAPMITNIIDSINLE